MTLVELCLALTLAALLAAATAGVVKGMVRHRDALPPAGPAAADRQLADLLRADLAAARRVHARPDRVTLLGYGGRDPDTGRPTWRPAEVTLAALALGDGSGPGGGVWLVRSVRDLDGPPARPRVTLLRPGVAGLRLERADDRTDLTAPPGATASAPRPDRVRLTLLDAAGAPLGSVLAGGGGP